MAEHSGTLHLVVVSHDRKLLDVRCSEVTLPGREGDLGVLPGHAPLIGNLRPGALSYTGGESGGLVISAGFCQVYDDTVTVLTERAALPGEIDGASARERIAELHDEMQSNEDPDRLVELQDFLGEAEAMVRLVP